MTDNKDSPSWWIYLDYYRRKSAGQKPKHLYDGYPGPRLTVEKAGPFLTKPPNAKLDNDISSIDTQLPSDIKLISPIEADVERVKDSLQQSFSEEVNEDNNTPLIPSEINSSEKKGYPHLKRNTSEEISEGKNYFSKTIEAPLEKRRKKLSLSEIREKITQSSPWQKMGKKN
jgi:hypothetical protein